jgi:hypothetical protein
MDGRVRFPVGAGFFLYAAASRPAVGTTQPPIQWVSEALSLGVKQSGCEADYSPPSGAEIKNVWNYSSTPIHVFLNWCLIKHTDNNTLLASRESTEVGTPRAYGLGTTQKPGSMS